MSTTQPRAIALLRVSQRDANALSPEVQRRACIELCRERGWQLDERDILDENVDDNGRVRNVSGSWTLDDRPKLRYALDEVEHKRATIIVGERFDRMFRNELLRRMVVRRVEDATGQLWSKASGEMTNQRAEARLAHNVNGDVSEYTLDTAKERSWDAVELAIARGTFTGPVPPPGYVVTPPFRQLAPDKPEIVQVVRRAFELRDSRASIVDVQAFLREHGIKRSTGAVAKMLQSRIYLGELRPGRHTPNLAAHVAIIDRDLFDRVQRRKSSPGRQAKSQSLLARLQVLRCETCDGRMSISASGKGRRATQYRFYRCTNERCTHRANIGAPIVERAVHEAMPELIAAREGHASQLEEFDEAQQTHARAQQVYDDFVEVFDPSEPADVKRKIELRDRLQEVRARLERFERRPGSALDVPIGIAWPDLTLDEQRATIQLHVERIAIEPGRGPGRITIDALNE
jgi:site-specific DNA recombinase